MSRRVPVQEIRGSDPTLLEVQLSEVLRRPLGQVAPVNVMDLIELASTEGRPRSLAKALDAFVDSVARQVSDIPAGRSFSEYLEEFQGLDGTRVPHRFREILVAECDRRSTADREQLEALLEGWAGQEPEPFELGRRKATVMRPRPPTPKVSSEPSSPPRGRSSRGSGGGGGRRSAPARVVMVDSEREEFIRDLALEKLARASENGLGEVVLIAGIRHLAKERYPDMLPQEITSVLKALKDGQQVRYSAGRWSLPTRF